MVDRTTIWKLRQMQAEIRRLLNEAGRPEYFQPAHVHYVVVSPSGGIPPATGNEPGTADCVITRRWGTSPKTLTDTTQEVTVYNMTQSEIPEGQKVLVHQDAWGDYWVTDGGGQVLIKAPSGGIPQRVGSLLGSATCDVYEVNSVGQLADTGNNITVKNWGVNAACANGDRYGWAEFYDGVWWVVSEDCGDEGTQVSGALTLNPADTGESYDYSTTTAASLFVTPRAVTYTAPIGVVPA